MNWKRWGPPKRIDLTNADAFAQAAPPRKLIDQVARRQLVTMHGHITIRASDYELAGECDQPISLAKFNSVVRPNDMIASKENAVANCG